MGNCMGKKKPSSNYRRKKVSLLTYLEDNHEILKELIRDLGITRQQLVIYKMGAVNLAEVFLEVCKGDKIPVKLVKRKLKDLNVDLKQINVWY